jgi:hypothetical protein
MDGTFMFTGEHESAIQNMRESSRKGGAPSNCRRALTPCEHDGYHDA